MNLLFKKLFNFFSSSPIIKIIIISFLFVNINCGDSFHLLFDEQRKLLSIEITPAINTIPKGSSLQYTAIGTFSDDTTEDLTDEIVWSAENPVIATIESDEDFRNLAKAESVGTTKIRGEISTISGEAEIIVTPPEVVSITVTPVNDSIAKGLTLQYTAIGTYTDESTNDISNTVTWTSSYNGIASISNSAGFRGLATANAVGTDAIITAKFGTISDSTNITVTEPELASIAVSPDSDSIVDGTTLQFTAIGTYTDGSTNDITNTVTWTSSNTGITIISNSAGTEGIATGQAEGTVIISATLGTISDSTNSDITVTPAELVSITVSPDSDSIVNGTTLQFTAIGTYTDGSTNDITDTVTWTSSNTGITTISNTTGSEGLATGQAIGTITISAVLGTIFDSTNSDITVTAAELVSIAVSPVDGSIATGKTLQYTAIGTYTDASTTDITDLVTWTSSNAAAATVNDVIGFKGLAAGQATGITDITASSGSISDSKTLTVIVSELLSIVITPKNNSIAKGLAVQYTAMGTYSDSSIADITTQVEWSSTNTTVASISNTSGSEGLASALSIGITKIGATLDTITSSTTFRVTPPELVSIAVTPVDDSIAKGLTLQYTAIGTYTDASTQDITDSVTWTSTNTGIAAISNSNGSEGLATAQAVGATKITATSDAISDTTNLIIAAPELVSIAVTPVNDSIAKGLTLQYTAIGTYTDASTKDITDSVTWTSSDTGVGTISNTTGFEGLATAQNIGTTVITATIDAISDSTNFTVTVPELVLIAVNPVNNSIAMGLTSQYTALGTYTDASTVDITDSVTWTSSDTGIATISNTAGSEGLATAQNIGTTTITAASGAISESVNFTVTAPALVTIAVTPVDNSIAKGLTLQYTAVGTYTDASTVDITDSVIWASSDTGIAAISNTAGSEGFTTAQNIGTVVITATKDTISGSTNLTVTAPEVISIAVTPVDDSISKGLTLQYTAIGTYTDASTKDITDSVTWSSTNTGVATISNTVGSEGLTTAQAVGATKITATSGAISDTTNLTVTAPALVSIVVTPVNDSIAKGLTLQFTAIGTYTDASTLDITNSVTWSSTIASVATISNAAGSEGLASAQNIGTAIITAKDGAVSDSTNFTVTVPELVSIAVTPVDDSIAKGLTLQYTAIGTYTDASTLDITDSATWSSSNTGIATISNVVGSEGLATAQNIGTAVITAASGSVSGSTNLTVTVPELVSIAITPVDDSIAKGLTSQYTAIGTYTDASTLDITDSVTWSSTNTGTATISNAAGSEGLVTAQAIGATKITATSDTISDTTNLTVTVPELVSIAVTPVDDSVAKGLTLQYTAIGTYTDASTQDITATVTWTSSDEGIATIDASGLASAVSEGVANITAADGAVNNSTTLTVTPKELVSIAVTPVDDSVAQGLTLQYTAIGTYTDSSTEDITGTVTWTSSNNGIASIDASGLASAVSIGVANITAADGAVNSSTTITVTPKELVSIAVSPVDISIAKGLTQQYTAIGTYTDLTTEDITGTVVWSSTSPGVANIDAGGLARAVSMGGAKITAISGGISDTTNITVIQKELVSIAVTPINDTVVQGLTLQYTAIGTYTDSSTEDITGTVTWTSSNNGIASIDASGLASAVSIGVANITAADGAVNSSATITVTPKELVSIAVSPVDISIAKGLTQQYTAIGTYTDSSTEDITGSVTWTSTNSGVASINASGLASAVSAGAAKITATSSAISDTTNITVTAKELVSIAISPVDTAIAKGLTQQYTAIGTYTDLTTEDITATVTWASSGSGIASINASGLATAVSIGVVNITAAQGAVNNSTTLTVTGRLLVSIAVSPVDISIAKGLTQQYTAIGTYTDASTEDITGTVTWSSTNSGVASINASGLASAVSEGATKITATSGAISDTTNITVTVKELVSIAVAPVNISIARGLTQQYAATGTYTDSSTANITGTVAWSSANSGIASINASGLATAVSVGTTTITASSGAISDTTNITVTAKELVSIAVSPVNTSIPKGLTQQFTAIGTYTDATTANITGSVTWTSTNGGVASINTSGLANAVSEGATLITAAKGAVNNSTTFTVTAKELVSIAVSPVDISIAKGLTQQYTATGTYTDTTTENITGTVSWSSTNGGVASINASGLASAVSMGAAKITATSGTISDTTNITVTVKELVSIAVTPVNGSVAKGQTLQYTAIGTYTDSTTENITTSVTWTSTNGGVATINAMGLANALLEGSTTITAAQGAINDSETLTVTGKELVSIVVSPVDISIAKGLTQQYTAIGTYTDTSTENITGSVTWSSTNGGVASINASGLASAVSEGAAKITATSGAISDTTNITVTVKELVSIAVSPVDMSIAKGLTQQYTAIGTYTDSSTANITGSVTWSSTNSGIASINASGLASAVSIGITQISAASGAISDTTNITVTTKELVSIAVTPENTSVAKGLTQQFTAIGTYTDSTTENITTSVTWTSTNGGVATINTSGLASAVSEGSTLITASQGAINNSTTFTVTGRVLVSIAVSPVDISIAQGLTQQYTAIGTYTDTTTTNITASVTWTSSNGGVASINASGLATAVSAGSTLITASQGAINDSTTFTVTVKQLVSIAVSPVDISIAKGRTRQYTAIGTYTDSTTANITGSVTWSSTNSVVARINVSGLATADLEGAAKITATSGTVSDTTNIIVAAPEIVSIDVTPNSISIPDGKTTQFTATGTYTDGSTADVTDIATWSAVNPAIANVSDIFGTKGLATGQSVGSTIIDADIGAISGSANLTVTAPVLEIINVTPANPSVVFGSTVQYTAQGTYSDSSVVDITASATWSSSNNGIATIDNAGLATGESVGSATITANLDSIDGTASINVTAPVLVSITITPVNDTVIAGSDLQYIAMGTYSDSSTGDITNSVTWSSTNTAFATISNSPGFEGLATGVATGSTNITATLDAVSDSTSLTVTELECANIEWPLRLGGVNRDMASSVTVDTFGDIIITGTVIEAADLNGDGDTADGTVESIGYGSDDGFISKFNSCGTLLWAKRLGGTSGDSGKYVATDTSGNIIVSGYVEGPADLNGDGDTTDGTAESTGIGSKDIFITKFDASGNHLWAKRFGGTSWDVGYSITIDTSGNIIVSGEANGAADFNGDGDTTDGTVESMGYGGTDAFISKFDANGNHLWAKRFGGTLSDETTTITVDISGNIIVTGSINGPADFNGDGDTTDGTVESTGYGFDDGFLSKFDASGNHLWAKRFGGIGNDITNSNTVDTEGNIFVVGFVTEAADLNGDGDTTDGTVESTGYGLGDIFISKFTTSGTFLWTKRLGSIEYDSGISIKADTAGNIIVAGYVTEAADLNGDGDTTDGTYESTAYGSWDIFVSKFNNSGTFSWTKRLGGTGQEIGSEVTTDASGNIILVGWTRAAADLNGDGDILDGPAESTPYGMADIFITKFDSFGNPIDTSFTPPEPELEWWELEVTTTAANQNMTIDFDGPVNMTIDWGDGTVETTTNTTITHTYSSAGTYTLKLQGMASRISFNNADANARLTGILSVVQGISGLTSFASTFEDCGNLTGSIPAGLFDNNTLVTDFDATFWGCSGLTGSIPAGLFDNNTQVTTFYMTFNGCSGLTGSIPAGLFDNNTLVTIFHGTFWNCSGLTGSIPAGLFDYNTQVTEFRSTFHGCSGLTGSIPAGLFDNNTKVTSFNSTFQWCSGLTGSIPAGLFDNNPLVTLFYGTFWGCSGLTGSIPTGLFDNNTQVTYFMYTFLNCSGLTGSIPAGLFDYNTQVTTFYMTFNGCSGLTGSIPAGLFDNNPLVTDFFGTFGNCSGLTGSIPAGLFDNNTQVTDFQATFSRCSGLTSIPAGLFNNNTLVTNFRSTFYNCSGLTSIPAGLFNNNTLVTNFRSTFYRCSGVTSAVPTLWISHPGAADHDNCFYGVTNASNYGSIPVDWR